MSIREYHDGDEKEIFNLWRASFPDDNIKPDLWLKRWRWMYKDNPVNPSKILIAEDNGKIIGQYPLYYLNLKVGDKVIKTAQNINLVIHPDYRHRGIYSKLESMMLVKVTEEKCNLVIGFPNDAAYKGHIKSGWFNIGNIQARFKVLDWAQALKIRIGNKYLRTALAMGAQIVYNKYFFRNRTPIAPKGLSIEKIVSFDERFNKFWKTFSDKYPIIVVRNKEYLNWRYSTPGADFSIFSAKIEGEICGFLVLEHKIQNSVRISFIMDLISPYDNVKRCLLNKAIEASKQKKSSVIIYYFIADKSYYISLNKSGFISMPKLRFGSFCAYSNSIELTQKYLQNIDNWFIQIGDSDFF